MLEVSSRVDGEELRVCSRLRFWQGSMAAAVQEGPEHTAQQRLAEAARGASSLACCLDPPGLSVPTCQMGGKNPLGLSSELKERSADCKQVEDE